MILDNIEVNKLSSKKMNQIRLETIGFAFQSSNLLPYLTVQDQLLLISELAGKKSQQTERKAKQLLERLGLTLRTNHYPESLSSGERQPAAIARAWMNDQEIILADEPTASLDSERGQSVVKMLAEEVKLRTKRLLCTHDKRMLNLCDRVVYIEDGKLTETFSKG